MNSLIPSLVLAGMAAFFPLQARQLFGPVMFGAAVDGDLGRTGVPTLRSSSQEALSNASGPSELASVSEESPPEPPPEAEAEPSVSEESEDEEEIFPAGLLKFQDTDTAQVLAVYQELTGRTVLRPSSLPQVRITLTSQTPLTRREAVHLLDSALALNGIVMIPQGDNVVKAVPVGQAGQEGRAFNLTPPEDLPESGVFIAEIIRLQHKRASEMAQILQPLAKNPQSILALEEEGILIVRDHAVNVKRMREIIDMLDVPPDRTTPKQGGVLLLYFLASAAAGLLYRPFLGFSCRGAGYTWLAAVLMGWITFLVRFPQDAPDQVAGSAAAWGAVGAGWFFVVLIPFLVKLHGKWIGGQLTEEEKARGAAGLRAWLSPFNLVMAGGIALFAWLGFGCSFWVVLALALGSLMAYTFALSADGRSRSAQREGMAVERAKALKLLEEGTITVRECSHLLDAISRSAKRAFRTSWPGGIWQKLLMAGGALVLAGFFLPWFYLPSAPDSPGSITGGEVLHGLGWFILLFGVAAPLLSYVAERWDPGARQRLTLCLLGAGAVMLLYLLASGPGPAGIGIFLVLLGYVLQFVGAIREMAP